MSRSANIANAWPDVNSDGDRVGPVEILKQHAENFNDNPGFNFAKAFVSSVPGDGPDLFFHTLYLSLKKNNSYKVQVVTVKSRIDGSDMTLWEGPYAKEEVEVENQRALIATLGAIIGSKRTAFLIRNLNDMSKTIEDHYTNLSTD